jgi:nucleoid-associated protein YgaU
MQMNNQAGWATAGNYGIAAIAVAIIIGIGLFFTGVIAPVEISKSPDTQTQAETGADSAADTAQDTSAGQTEDIATGETEGQAAGAEVETGGDVAAVNPEGSLEGATEPVDDAADATEETALAEDTGNAGDEAVLPSPPMIDVFRLETDGGMLIAGQAEPGWEIKILVDGATIATVTPDAAGQFVEFLDLEYSDQPRVLSLLMLAPDGQVELASTDEIILAPTQKPVQTAAVDTAEAEPGDEGTLAQADPSENGEAGTVETGTAETGTDETGADDQQESGSQAVLLANESGVRVLQPPEPTDKSPEVMSTVALDAITYSDEGQVQLAGRAIGTGSVRVYLNNTPVITTTIAEDGNWRSDLPQVDTGVYTLRVDELDDEGRVTSRVETPFKREDEEILAQANADQASSKIRAVTVQPGSTLWAISREAYGEGTLFVRVFEANSDRIRDPDLIYPGQVFTIPE